MDIEDNGQGRDNDIKYIKDFSAYYITLKAVEILCFTVIYISMEMVSYSV